MRRRSHRAPNVATGSETQGIDNFAIADVAAGAGVQETSIFYRRWGSRRENAVVAALLDDRTTTIAITDTGYARTAFSVIERVVAERLSTGWSGIGTDGRVSYR
jgi:hypothetical protein